MTKLLNMLSPLIYCILINTRNWMRGKHHRIHPTQEPNIYRVTDGADDLFICRRNRHNRSKKGVKAGVDTLAKLYSLDEINLDRGDLLVDCGANIGELGVWARNRGLNYVAFEPEPIEARCVDLNAYNGEARAHRLALWYEEKNLKFFSKPNSADSSAIEINDFDTVYEVPAKRLDSIIGSLPSHGKVVLKIEAEGAEPEVLAGTEGILHRVSYIAIDCGFERGKEGAHTFVETNTFLVDRGFRVERANFPRMTMIYRNTSFS